jgi:hypothetical protein
LSKEKNEHTTGNRESFQNHLYPHRIKRLGNCLCRVGAQLADFHPSQQQIFFNADQHADAHSDLYTDTDQHANPYADQHADGYANTDRHADQHTDRYPDTDEYTHQHSDRYPDTDEYAD